MKTIRYDLSSPKQALDELAEAMKAGDKAIMLPVDPYLELRRAQDKGKIVQYLNYFNEWEDGRHWEFTEPPERYRIKPDTVKMWQWVIRSNHGVVKSTIGFFTDEESVKKSINVTAKVLQRADWTEIEVEQ